MPDASPGHGFQASVQRIKTQESPAHVQEFQCQEKQQAPVSRFTFIFGAFPRLKPWWATLQVTAQGQA